MLNWRQSFLHCSRIKQVFQPRSGFESDINQFESWLLEGKFTLEAKDRTNPLSHQNYPNTYTGIEIHICKKGEQEHNPQSITSMRCGSIEGVRTRGKEQCGRHPHVAPGLWLSSRDEELTARRPAGWPVQCWIAGVGWGGWRRFSPRLPCLGYQGFAHFAGAPAIAFLF